MAMGLAAVVASVIVGAALFLGLLWFLLPFLDSKACPSCASRRPLREAACGACGAALPGPAQAHPDAPPYGFPAAEPPVRGKRVRVEDGVAYNRGISRRVVTLATAAMGLGIGLRILGLLGVLGLPQIPAQVDGALTIVGGVVAFVGFVFLDAA